MPKTPDELKLESELISAAADTTVAAFANSNAPRIPTHAEYIAAINQLFQMAFVKYPEKHNQFVMRLANNDFISTSIKRYHDGLLNHPNRADVFDKAVQANLLSDTYFLTGKAMRAISREKEIRTFGDCLIFPIIRSLHWAAAEEIGSRYQVESEMKHVSDHADVYLQNALSTGLGGHGFKLDNERKDLKPNLIYLHDEDQTEALRLHIEGGLLKVFDPGSNSLVPLHTENWRNTKKKDLKDNTAHSQGIHDQSEVVLVNGRKLKIKGKFGVAGFAMSIRREIYVRKHHVMTGPAGMGRGIFYHSSYLAGNDIICSGCLMVKHGELIWADNMSGHYQPSLAKLLVLLQTLQAQGVDIKPGVVVYDRRENQYYLAKELLEDPELHQAIHDVVLPIQKIPKVNDAIVAYEKTQKGWFRSVSTESREAVKNMKKRTGKSLMELAFVYTYRPNLYLYYDDDYDTYDTIPDLSKKQLLILNGFAKKYELTDDHMLNQDSTLRKILKNALGQTMADAGIS